MSAAPTPSARPGTGRLLLRATTDEDVPALAAAFASNADILPLAGVSHTTIDVPAVRRYLRAAAAAHGGLTLTIVERATCTVIGVATLLVPNSADGVPWIGLLLIAAGYQGKGRGREAVAAIEALLGRHGWRELRLNVVAANARALQFWRRIGYRPYPAGGRAYDGRAPATVMLAKPLRCSRPPDVSREEASTWFG